MTQRTADAIAWRVLQVTLCAVSFSVLGTGMWLAFVRYRQQLREDVSPRASCVSLYAMARTSTDSLYVAVNRGDCVANPISKPE